MRKASLHVVAAVGVVLAGGFNEARADLKLNGATEPTIDSRRTHDGAKVTAEANPGADTNGASDDKRLNDSYEPKGVDLGLFLFLPKVEVEEAFNSNIYATAFNAKTDLITAVKPEFTLRSRFAQDALNFHVSANNFTYKTYSAENHTDISGDVDGRLDIGAGSELNAFARLYSGHEDRTSPDDKSGNRPTPTHGFVGRVGGKTDAGHFSFLSDVTAQRFVYEAVQTTANTLIPNGDRDRWEVEGRVRASYELFPGYAAVSQFSMNDRAYDASQDRSGYSRSSRGYRAEAGVGIDLSQLLRGDFLVGYLEQNYQDSRFTTPRGVSLRSTFNWTPDKLTIIVPQIERTVAETTTAGASGMVTTTGSVLVRHEMARNILLSGYGAVTYEDYKGLSQHDWLYEGRAKITYSFAPEVYVGGEVAYKLKDSNVYTTNYRQGIMMLRLGLQL